MTERKKISFNYLLERWRFRYRLFILNEKTLENVFHVNLSRFTAFWLFFGAFVVLFVLISLLILHSPVKHFLPGASDVTIRRDLIEEVAKIDSLSRHIYLQDLQLKSMKNIMEGSVSSDTVMDKPHEISVEKWKEIADTKSEREQQFLKDYEADFMGNISQREILDVKNKNRFIAPALGNIAKDNDKGSNLKGVVLSGKNGQAILATASGTIVSSTNMFDGYVVVIQHKDGYVSVYKNLPGVLKGVGESVSASEPISIFERAQTSITTFEIWQDGTPIDPRELISF
ncbi:MAG: M23 family metallopeptidase [Prevotellaceae bacterium]|jgi:hypothetical protein|nr:M23 family metallopeptidase [Prevotellaceae bacterium]